MLEVLSFTKERQCLTVVTRPLLIGLVAYRLKYVHAAIANKTIVAIQRDQSLMPVFLAMNHILCRVLPVKISKLFVRAGPILN